MSENNHSMPPANQLPEVADDFAPLAGEAIKEAAHHATKSVADSAKEMYHSTVIKTEDALTCSKECVRRNPMAFVLGSVFLGAAIGYLIINGRRKPTFAERFADEPIGSVREAIRSAFAPVAHRVHDGYDTACEGVGKVMDQVHRLRPSRTVHSMSDRIGRAAHNLKFW